MDWFDFSGALMMAAIMVPNIIYARKNGNAGFENNFSGALLPLLEQIGRYGCFATMLINIPALCLGHWFAGAARLELFGGIALLCGYYGAWRCAGTAAGKIALATLPSLLFVLCAFARGSLPLGIFAALFAPTHIAVTLLNLKAEAKMKKKSGGENA